MKSPHKLTLFNPFFVANELARLQGKLPMTDEEIRSLILLHHPNDPFVAKLRLEPNDPAYLTISRIRGRYNENRAIYRFRPQCVSFRYNALGHRIASRSRSTATGLPLTHEAEAAIFWEVFGRNFPHAPTPTDAVRFTHVEPAYEDQMLARLQTMLASVR